MSINLLEDHGQFFLQKIDWYNIILPFSSKCHFEKSTLIAQHFLKYNSKHEIEYHLDILEEMIQFLNHDSSFISSNLQIFPQKIDFYNSISKIEKHPIFTIEELNFVCLLSENVAKIFKKNSSWKIFNNYSIYQQNIEAITKGFSKDFRRFVSSDAQIDYLKHHELGPLFSKLSDIEKNLREKIIQISKQEEFKNVVQFGGFDIIFERYVLPIRSDGYNNELGPIIAKSNSGMTLYVEPFEVRNLSTLRVKLMAEIENKIQKICNNYSHFLHTHADFIFYLLNLIIEIDLNNAKAQYCTSNNLTRPKISNRHEIVINNFFHPLINNPIKNSFSLESSLNGIIISGPNTGGKTIVLKSIAIIHLFLHCGLFVPATLAIIPHFDSIFYMGSDNQNLIQGLSSFSSEVENYFNLFKNMGHKSLIIIDEIFNSTASEEASALALALLEEFVSLNNLDHYCKIFVSTHHNLLKSYLDESKLFLSAHMGFDGHFKRPTYQLFLGSPGSSMALEVFESLAKNTYHELEHISQRSQEVLGEKYLTYERQLQEISHKNLSLDRLLNENKQLNIELKNQKNSYDGLLFLEKKDAYDKYTDKLKKIYDQASALILDTKSKKIETISKLNKEIAKINSEMHSFQELPPKAHDLNGFYDVSPSQLFPGRIYYSIILNSDVTLISFNKKNEANVSIGKINFRCPIDSLKIHRNNLKKSSQTKSTALTTIEWETQNKTDYDCRGMRLDSFINIVELSLMELLAEKIPYLKYIHGHGEGILKKWLREKLKKENEFHWESDSNDGVTLVTLK